MEAIQLIHGCHMQPTMARTLMQLMLMLPKHTLIITIWHNMAVYLGYRNTTDTAQGNNNLSTTTNHKSKSTPFLMEIIFIFVRLFVFLLFLIVSADSIMINKQRML